MPHPARSPSARSKDLTAGTVPVAKILTGGVTGGVAAWARAGIVADFSELTTSYAVYDGFGVGLAFGYRNHLVRTHWVAPCRRPP